MSASELWFLAQPDPLTMLGLTTKELVWTGKNVLPAETTSASSGGNWGFGTAYFAVKTKR